MEHGNGRRALVTGAGGFLGQYVAEQLLAAGWRVRTLARGDYPALTAAGAECVRGDLRDAAATRGACAGCDVVFHVAGVAGIWGPREHFWGINVHGTEHVIAACRAEGIGRLVYTSSPSVTFDGSPQEGVDERVGYPTQWLCHYAETKALAEQAVLAAHEPGRLHTCALRPHLIWGPRDTQLVPRLVARARQGRLRRVGDGRNLIDMIYVENAAEAHLLAADRLREAEPAGGKAYFLSQGEPVRCWEWIDEILALVDLPAVRRSISLSGAWRVGVACEKVYGWLGIEREPPMTRFLAAQLALAHWFDITRARRELGYEPRVKKAEGMRRLGEWLRGGAGAACQGR